MTGEKEEGNEADRIKGYKPNIQAPDDPCFRLVSFHTRELFSYM